MNAGPTLAPGPKGVPVLGSLPAWKKDTAGFLLGVNRDYGQVARVGLGPITMHLVTEPAAVQRVLVDNNSNYVRGTLYEQFATVMGSGLLTTDGPAWRAHRRTVQPVFLRKAVEALAPNIVQATNAMLDRWEVAAAAGQRVDLMAESLHGT
ncbi:cytochrome P450 [Jatrophihabitans lederbergiae]|uniref:Cytochrome P450 n=1 Tax=Jatrophihabitans lederbergiae TaxID=3075547 RepID=A0ABU2JI13_9ACTN|nr:cytochrome P450 [Jatrophihabitans sp. DSM 44399]MDT0264339.1 cytochrome P450 [Jatrophihabitans sp. DSM 44399]